MNISMTYETSWLQGKWELFVVCFQPQFCPVAAGFHADWTVPRTAPGVRSALTFKYMYIHDVLNASGRAALYGAVVRVGLGTSQCAHIRAPPSWVVLPMWHHVEARPGWTINLNTFGVPGYFAAVSLIAAQLVAPAYLHIEIVFGGGVVYEGGSCKAKHKPGVSRVGNLHQRDRSKPGARRKLATGPQQTPGQARSQLEGSWQQQEYFKWAAYKQENEIVVRVVDVTEQNRHDLSKSILSPRSIYSISNYIPYTIKNETRR